MGTQNTVTVFESKGVIEARKLKPKIENAKRVMLETVIEIGQRYSDLDDANKADFRTELGLQLKQAQTYARIAERYFERARRLPGGTECLGPLLEKTVYFADRLVSCSDETFEAIVQSGQITLASSGTQVQRATAKLSPLKRKLLVATTAMKKAAMAINAIRALMEKEGITSMRGPEVKQLREEFQLLCAELMAADPATVEQAKKILKGEQ